MSDQSQLVLPLPPSEHDVVLPPEALREIADIMAALLLQVLAAVQATKEVSHEQRS